MPFNTTTGVYTPPTGAEDATPGAVIRSATWNTIFTDISTALTQLGEASWLQAPRVISSPGNITVAATDNVIMVQANVGTIVLPACATKQGPVRIMGAASGNFGTNNCVVIPNGVETLSGLGSLVLRTNYQVASFYPMSSGGYVIY